MSVNNFLPKSNISTSIFGWVALIAGAVMANPDALSFLPDNFEKAIHGISVLITFIAGGAFASSVKNKDVTGGSVPSTDEAMARLLVHLEQKHNDLSSLEKHFEEEFEKAGQEKTDTELDLEKTI